MVRKLSKHIALLFLGIIPVFLNGQDTVWQADFVVRHPSGIKDTLTIGFDPEGGKGYQVGLDEIDTNFTTPISIRSHDPKVVQNYNTCHANMRRDIRSFEQTIMYSFYIKSDTFPRADLYPPDSCVSILYDTTQLKYKDSMWKLYGVKITSYSGYLGVWDEWYRYLVSNGEFGIIQVGQIPLIFENNLFIDYWGNPCGSGDKVMKFELEVVFSLKTGIDTKPKGEVSIKNNRGGRQLNVTFPQEASGHYQIINIMGQKVATGKFPVSDRLQIPYRPNAGVHLILINTGKYKIRKKFISP